MQLLEDGHPDSASEVSETPRLMSLSRAFLSVLPTEAPGFVLTSLSRLSVKDTQHS